MGQLNTTEMYHLSVLGAASPIKRGRDHAPPDASVGGRFLASSVCYPARGNIPLISASSFSCLSSCVSLPMVFPLSLYLNFPFL